MSTWTSVSDIFHNDYSDKRMNDFPLMDNGCVLVIIIGAYLLFVLKIGPTLMRDREAFKLRAVLLVFNAAQVVLCLGVTVTILATVDMDINRCYTTETKSVEDMTMLKVSYFYWVIKMVDLLDTVFFVLRKKHNQVSLLHVYHHSMMASVGWLINKYYPAGELLWSGFLNCIVHVFMYAYYFCSVLYDGKVRFWWKKYITQGQLLQFVALAIIYTKKLFDSTCSYPKALLVFHLSQVFLMLYLFVDFYYKTYIRAKKIKK